MNIRGNGATLMEHLKVKIRAYNDLLDLPGLMNTEIATGGWDEGAFIRFEAKKTSKTICATFPETGYVCAHLCLTIEPRTPLIIRRIAVKPHFQRRGIGTQLIDEAISMARKRQRALIMPVPCLSSYLYVHLWLRGLGAKCYRWADSNYQPGHDTLWFRF